MLPNVHAETLRTFKKGDGIVHAAETGVIDQPVAVDFDDPASMKKRANQTAVAGRHFRTAVQPLDAAETERLEKQLDTAPPAQAAATAETVSKAFGRDGALATAGQVGRNRPAQGVAVAIAGEDKKLTGEIFTGDRRDRPKTPTSWVIVCV